MPNTSPALLSDRELLNETGRVAARARQTTAELLALLAEVDARRLYLGEGYSSLFTYCTQALHLSEPAAYGRITAARAARRFPVILNLLADGNVTLTTISLLAAHLTDENHEALLEAARHQGKRDVERLVAALSPQPDILPTIRALPMKAPVPPTEQDLLRPANGERLAPAPTPPSRTSVEAARQPSTAAAVPRRAAVTPLAPRRYLLRVTIGEETQRKLARARDLLRHELADGNLAAIIDRALTLLVAQTERTKFAATTAKSRGRVAASAKTRSRRIPAAVRRAVWARDQGRCVFAGPDGRCSETGFLEFHHIVPFAGGGPSTIENLELRCRGHNEHEAERAGLTLWREQPTRSGS